LRGAVGVLYARAALRPGPSQLFQVRARQDCAWSLKEFDSSRFGCHRGASPTSPLTPLRLLRGPKAPAPTEMTASMLLRRCFLALMTLPASSVWKTERPRYRGLCPTGATGLEPATPGFGDRCSTKLSYAPRRFDCRDTLSRVVRAGQRRVQGALFAFLTIFFAGVTWTAYDAGVWPIALAGAALTLWMGGLAVRTFRAARQA